MDDTTEATVMRVAEARGARFASLWDDVERAMLTAYSVSPEANGPAMLRTQHHAMAHPGRIALMLADETLVLAEETP